MNSKIVCLLLITGCPFPEKPGSIDNPIILNLPCDTKLVSIGWRNNQDLWYAARPSRSNEYPENTVFQERLKSEQLREPAIQKIVIKEHECYLK